MRNLIIIFLSCVMNFCSGCKNNEEHNLNFNDIDIVKMTYECRGLTFALPVVEIAYLTDKINSSRNIGPVKGSERKNLTIYFKNSEKINLRFVGNKFKLDKSEDWAYQLDVDINYLDELCPKKTEPKDSLMIDTPIKTIERIFNQYNEFQESTDSKENLDSLMYSLEILENTEVSNDDLVLVVNVWMYYTVTDFLTMEYTEKVLTAHRQQSIGVVENRIKNKMEWETENSAPYSDLEELLKKLKMNI